MEFRCCCSFFSVGSLGTNPDLNQDLPIRISQVCSPLSTLAIFRVSTCLRQRKTLTGIAVHKNHVACGFRDFSAHSLRIASDLLKIVPQWAGPPETSRNFPETSPKLPRNFPETSPKLPRNFPETSPKLPRNFPETSPKLPRNFPETSPKLPETSPKLP